MTAETLRAHTRKQLEMLARRDRVAGWHGMSKEQLVRALLKNYRAKSPQRPVANPDIPVRRKGGNISTTEAKIVSPEKAARSQAAEESPRGLIVESLPSIRDQLQVTPVDSLWLHVRWSLSTLTLERARVALGSNWRTAVPILRLFEVAAEEDGTRVRSRSADVPVRLEDLHWFVRTPHAGSKWLLEMGFRTTDGRFHSFLHAAPPARAASSQQRADAAPSANFEVQNLIPRTVAAARRAAASRSTAGEVSQRNETWDPALRAELRLLGKTSPGADVVIQHHSIPISEDGAFQVRVPLENGRVVIPAELLSPDAAEQRTFVVAVELNIREMERQVFDESLE